MAHATIKLMPEEEKDDVKNKIKSEIAQHKPRDEEGHFVHTEPPKTPEQSQPVKYNIKMYIDIK